MKYIDGSGRTGDDGAPASAFTGMGNPDKFGNDRSNGYKKPLFAFAADELQGFEGTAYALIPLHAPNALDARGRKIGKAPLKGWRDVEPLSLGDARQRLVEGSNVGVRLSRGDLVVDVDPRNFEEGDDPVARLQMDLGFRLDDYPQVVTGASGSHYYMLKPHDLNIVETLEAYPGIEFKSHGRQVVAPGSVHPETLQPYLWDALAVPLTSVDEAPRALLDLLSKPERPCATQAGDVSAEQLAIMLDALDPSNYREHGKWLELMMACHHATAGEGRDEFVAWSASDPQYSDHAVIVSRRWDSLQFDRGGPSVTIRTLYKALHEAGAAAVIPRTAAEDDFRDDPPASASLSETVPDKHSSVLNEWVYVIDAEQFVRRSDSKKWKKEQWKARYASLKADGDVLSAIWKGNLPLRKFEALVYLPGQPEFPDGEDGGRYNIWRESGVVAQAGDVQPFLDHIEYLFPDDAERGFVLDYLAMLVQAPGRKINYALLVRGGQGTGKSWLGRLMTRIIGSPNVTLPSNSEVMSNWTVWTEGAQLAIIEELMCVGRLDMANRLKPIITEPTLRIEAKGCSLYSIPNHLNLLAFTNHDDAMPIERGDRRWLVVFSEAQRRDETYYESLFGFLGRRLINAKPQTH